MVSSAICELVSLLDANRVLISPAVWSAVAPDSIPSSLVPSAATSRPSTVLSQVIAPLTARPVPFSSCKLSLLNLPVIVCDPPLICANSIAPSSEPSLASIILPVILA